MKTKISEGATLLVVEVVVYLAVALGMMWPVTFRLAEEFVGWRDANYYMWLSWRLGELIQSWDIFSFRIPDVIYPIGVDLRLIDGPLPSLYGGILNLLTGPFLAYNLTLLTGTLLNIWAARRVAQLFSKDRVVWMVVAVGFALAPAIALRMTVHLPMYFAFTLPLLIEEAIGIARGERTIKPLRAGLLLFVAYLCSIYYLIFGGLAFLVIVLVGSLRSPRFRQNAVRVGLSLLLTAVLMSPFLVARISRDRAETAEGGQPVLLEDSYRAGADVLSVVTQPRGSTIELPGAGRLRENFRDGNVHESTVFPGFLLLLGLAGLIFRRSRVALALAVTAAVLWVLSLGSSLKIDGEFLLTNSDGEPIPWLPFAAILKLPGLASLRAANRASYALAAVLAACLALSLGFLFDRYRARCQRAIVVAGCSLLLATSLVIPVPSTNLSVTSETGTALREVAERSQDGESVLLVPSDCTGETSWSVKLQILHRTPWIGCQTSPSAIPWYSGLDRYAESAELAALRCVPANIGRRETRFTGEETFEPSDMDILYEELGVRFVIVDKKLVARPSCGLEEDVVEDLRSFELLGEDDLWIVLDTRASG